MSHCVQNYDFLTINIVLTHIIGNPTRAHPAKIEFGKSQVSVQFKTWCLMPKGSGKLWIRILPWKKFFHQNFQETHRRIKPGTFAIEVYVLLYKLFTVGWEDFKLNCKTIKWDLHRINVQASGVQNILCVKSYIEGHRIHLLVSLADTANMGRIG